MGAKIEKSSRGVSSESWSAQIVSIGSFCVIFQDFGISRPAALERIVVLKERTFERENDFVELQGKAARFFAPAESPDDDPSADWAQRKTLRSEKTRVGAAVTKLRSSDLPPRATSHRSPSAVASVIVTMFPDPFAKFDENTFRCCGAGTAMTSPRATRTTTATAIPTL
jgi:hypothetical protein